jgi:hypothetical protein
MFFRTIFLPFILALTLFFGTVTISNAQEIPRELYDGLLSSEKPTEEEMKMDEEFFRKQPPLTESDLQIAIKFLPLASDESFQEDTKLDEYAYANGLEPDRLVYIVTKVSSGMLIAVSPEFKDIVVSMNTTEAALPTPEEQDLINKHFKELSAAVVKDAIF